jgi:outer membrane protein TolC
MSNSHQSAQVFLRRLTISFFVCLGLVPGVRAQEPAGPTPFTLTDCVRIGLQQQPALAAQRASLAAAEAQRVALDHMVCASLIMKELPIRKQQAALGVAISDAGVQILEWETAYAVTRCFYTVVYARKQETVVNDLIAKLDTSYKFAAKAVKDPKAPPDLAITQIDVDKLKLNMDLLELRRIEASVGVNRATAALREAMGLRHDVPLPLVLEDFPAVGELPDREALVQTALARRGELVQATCAARLTELEVCAQNTGCLLPYKKTFAAASDIHSRPIPEGTSNSTYRPAAVGIDMPTVLVGQKGDRVARAQELSQRASAVVEKTHGLIALETTDAYYKLQTAAGQVATLRESVKSAAKVAELVSGRFDLGKVSGEDYLRARTLEDATQTQLNEALFHHTLALAALERITAGGFTPSYRRAAK